jgi:hypothetical protein
VRADAWGARRRSCEHERHQNRREYDEPHDSSDPSPWFLQSCFAMSTRPGCGRFREAPLAVVLKVEDAYRLSARETAGESGSLSKMPDVDSQPPGDGPDAAATAREANHHIFLLEELLPESARGARVDREIGLFCECGCLQVVPMTRADYEAAGEALLQGHRAGR